MAVLTQYNVKIGVKWSPVLTPFKTKCINSLRPSHAIWPHITWSSLVQVMAFCLTAPSHYLNTLRPRQNGRHFPDDIFKCIFLNENAWISIKISLKFVPNGPINKIPSLVQIMALRRSGDKPLYEPMMVNFLTHICVTRPQWVNQCRLFISAVFFGIYLLAISHEMP